MGVAEAEAVDGFLESAASNPSALVVEGEAGIGKTTLWLRVVERARQSGFTVLSAQPGPAESVLAYSSLADLLRDVDAWTDLPAPQRVALAQVQLLTESDTIATNQRVVAAAFLSVLNRLAAESPLLLAIDDLHWLDPSSAQVVEFAARRLSGPVGILGVIRVDDGAAATASWLRLPRPDAVRRIQVAPMSVGDLHNVVSDRLGRTFARPLMLRIAEISRGNPFYALELARAASTSKGTGRALPGTLAELVSARIGSLDSDAQRALLAVACTAAPTVHIAAQAIRTGTNDVVALLEDAESAGIIAIDGHTIRFTHPLLAEGVYASATPARRRSMHERLAEVVTQPELQARHRALAATTSDPVTAESLDAAAEIAHRRGAPAAAAELLELAIGLGADTPRRRILLAQHHFNAGDLKRARVLLEDAVAHLAPGALRTEALSNLAFVRMNDESFPEAIDCLTRALSESEGHLALRVQILTTLSFCLLMVGDLFSALRNSEDARADAEVLGQSHLLSQALSMRVLLGALAGEGIDEATLLTALEIEDRDAYAYIFLRPSFHRVLMLAWDGRIDEARPIMMDIYRGCVERGEETELVIAAFNFVVGLVWSGEFAQAGLIAEDAVERGEQLGGDTSRGTALTARAEVAVYTGRVDDARRDLAEALVLGQRSNAGFLMGHLLKVLGFLEVSVGNYDAALLAVAPLIAMVHAAPDATEIFVAEFIGDAVEAYVQLGRLDEAEPLVAALERNGQRLNRAWMLAVGGRCRALLSAAKGDLESAAATAMCALSEHDRLTMPFERARTQLVLGQLQRRRVRQHAASVTLRAALDVLDQLGAPLWADRARAELDRTTIGQRRAGALTPSERRVAELAASGKTNRDIAAALFISPKTVEANLSRIYHKLGIRSRAELGLRLSHSDS